MWSCRGVWSPNAIWLVFPVRKEERHGDRVRQKLEEKVGMRLGDAPTGQKLSEVKKPSAVFPRAFRKHGVSNHIMVRLLSSRSVTEQICAVLSP